ncbi:MAG: hypothetical protein IIT82_01780, partial [Selenomonas sp.]|nr:hypothetical protein [Selenomonas sp.]
FNIFSKVTIRQQENFSCKKIFLCIKYKSLPRSPPVTIYTIAANPFSRYKNIDVLVPCHCEIINLYGRRLGVEVVMLFAVERLSERSEDWPTNNSSWKLS